MIVCLDFETFYDQKYSLRKMSEVDYILSPQYQTIMCGIKVGDRPVFTMVGEREVRRAFAQIDWQNVAVLSHNMRFDGAILAWRFGIVPKLYLCTMSMARALVHPFTGKSSLDAVLKYLGLPAKGKFLAQAIGKRLEDFTPELLAEGRAYCADDTTGCRQIFDRFMGEYKFPRSELKVIDLNLRAFIQPQVKLNADKLGAYLDKVRAEKAQAFAQLEYTDRSVFSSNEKFAQLLQSHGVDVPLKLSPTTGELTYALARNDRAFKELCNDPDLPPLVQAMLAVRVGEKSTIDETRTVTLLNLAQQDWSLTAGFAPGTMPVPYRYYGAHCVPGSTEVLTPDGWVALEHWPGGAIAQVNAEQEIEFLPAERFVGPVTDQWIGVRAPYLGCDFTYGHTVPRFMQHHFTWDTIQASELLHRSFIWTPLAGRLMLSGTITPEQMRVLAMVQADGHWETDPAQGRGLAIFVKKPRKIERARALLAAAGVDYREGMFDSHPGFVRFSVRHADVPTWLTVERKHFGAWLLDSTVEAREALLQEVQHWDGWVQGNQICYSSSERINADWLATLAHLTGRCASISMHESTGRRRTNYRVQLRQRSYGIIEKDHVELLSRLQRAYCATTQTGFFLARSHGRIFVTGNTGRPSGDGGFNFTNLRRGSPIREAIEAPDGYVIVYRDSSQIECRVEAELAGCEKLLAAFRDGRDVYCEFGSKFYRRAVTKAQPTERHISKTAVLSLGYGAGHEKFRHALFIGSGGMAVEITLREAMQLVFFYRDEYHEVPALWKRAQKVIDSWLPAASPISPEPLPIVVQEGSGFRLPNGLMLNYPNARQEYDPHRQGPQTYYDGPYTRKSIYGAKLIENLTQALARIVVTDIGVRVACVTGRHPIMATYDSLAYCVPIGEARAFDAYLEDEFIVAPAWAKDLPLASEGGWGHTLLEAEKRANPQ